MSRHVSSLLCLGDSYTIGEGVPLYESFPYQAMQMLRRSGVPLHAPEIVAKTGWTTFELAEYLINHSFNEHYDFVTLLIGVNNQYRGLNVNDYADEFNFLLHKAIHFAGGNAAHVAVLSIPDWGVTPFAKGKDKQKIASAIDNFNTRAKDIATAAGVVFFDITTDQRKDGDEPAMLVSDQLHPSGKEYARWAAKIAAWIKLQC